MGVFFRDKLLDCEECGNQFVYTVGQQRLAYQEDGVVEDSRYCPVCQVKLDRMGPRESSPVVEGASNGGKGAANGHYPPGDYATNGRADDLVSEEGGWAAEPAPDAPALAGKAQSRDEPGSGKPAGYRTGAAHPLYGHEGERRNGVVKWFNDRKGFGFITLDDGNDLFVHYSGIAGEGYKTLKEGQQVTLELEDTEKGPQATRVRVVTEEPQPG